MSENFDAAVNEYRDLMEHDCSRDDSCEADEAFFLFGRLRSDGTMEIRSGGHKVAAPMVIESAIKVVDQLVMTEDLPPMMAFLKSRDLIHTAADGVEVPPDVEQGFTDFARGLGSDND